MLPNKAFGGRNCSVRDYQLRGIFLESLVMFGDGRDTDLREVVLKYCYNHSEKKLL